MSTIPSSSAAVHRVDYVEFACRDVAAAKKFFAAAFGWQFTDYGPDYTSFSDGRITGGFFTSREASLKVNPMIVIAAGETDLETMEKRVVAAGGKVLGPALEFPGGRRFQFTDPSGLELAVWSERRADGSKIP
jgi:uncharacterized protein